MPRARRVPEAATERRDSATQARAELKERAPARNRPKRTKADRRRIKDLEREVRCLDKAPAETAALHVLSKKRGNFHQGQGRGRMICLKDRQALARHIKAAHRAGAPLCLVCEEVADIDMRTPPALAGRPRTRIGLRQALGDAARAKTRAECCRTPADPETGQRAALCRHARGGHSADVGQRERVRGQRIELPARVLRAHWQARHCGCARPPRQIRPPPTHIATAQRQQWRWDMTLLLTAIKGRWPHLYLILDAPSCKIVGFEVHHTEAVDHAAHLVMLHPQLDAHWRSHPQTGTGCRCHSPGVRLYTAADPMNEVTSSLTRTNATDVSRETNIAYQYIQSFKPPNPTGDI